MAVAIDRPPPRRRKTLHPYASWFTGGWMRLEAGKDFYKEPRSIANTINSYAQRKGFCAHAWAARDESVGGSPYRFVFVWGDMDRPIEDGLPAEVLADMRRL